ncbi:TetR/AcrR family transcriptional regulator [Rothia sp. CCM 9416]|uniref:TetR/AcrR family transcriptional regulator n=1 Tax=Rothia sp. CCM 9416 TaxID=3402655 RepID=UPI003AD8CE6E
MQETSAQEVAIAEATIRVIVNQGFDQVSVRKVAQEAGIAPGTVQYHTGSRRHLLHSALERSIQRQNQRIQNLPSTQDPLERACLSLCELLPTGKVQREDAALWVTLGAAASAHSWITEIYQKELLRFQEHVAQGVTDLLQSQGAKPTAQRVTLTARLITALVNGLTLDYLHASPSPQLTAQIQNDLTHGISRILQSA